MLVIHLSPDERLSLIVTPVHESFAIKAIPPKSIHYFCPFGPHKRHCHLVQLLYMPHPLNQRHRNGSICPWELVKRMIAETQSQRKSHLKQTPLRA